MLGKIKFKLLSQGLLAEWVYAHMLCQIGIDYCIDIHWMTTCTFIFYMYTYYIPEDPHTVQPDDAIKSVN